MPSPAAGVLVEILAGEGDTVETGSRVAVIDENAQAQSPSEPGTAPSSTLASTPTSTAPAVSRPTSRPRPLRAALWSRRGASDLE